MAQVIKKIKVDNVDNPVEQAFYLSTSTGASDGTGLSTVAGNGSSGSYKSVRWYIKDVAGISAPYDGMRIAVKVPLNGVSTAGIILSINGNTDADYHPVAYNVNTVLTSHFPQNTIKVFTYDASQTMTCYKASNTAVSVTGVWKADANYDSNTTVTYGTLEYYFRPYNGANALYRYKFCMLDKDNRIVPLTTTNVANGTAVTNQTPTSVAFRPDKIWWYCTTTTINAGALLGGQTLWRSGYNANNANNGGMAICNFNSTISTYKLIYLCGTYNKTTGLFSLRGGGTASSTQYYTQVPTNTANITLSSYFTSGYDYILLGGTYSSNNYIQLFDNNPMFHFDGTNLVPYDTWNTAQNAPVNADWNAASGLSQILNKPTIPAAQVNADWNATTGVASILNKPTIPTNTNQTVKAGTVTFGANDVVNFVAGGNVAVTGDATNKSITISYTTPASLKNPNALHIYGETTKVLDYDGSAAKSLYIKASTTSGAFTVSDGTSSKLIQLAGDFTNTHYTSTWSVYAGTTCISTFNQSANRSITFKAGNNIALTGTANSGIITISATPPAATGYAGNLEVKASAYTNGIQSLTQLNTRCIYLSDYIVYESGVGMSYNWSSHCLFVGNIDQGYSALPSMLFLAGSSVYISGGIDVSIHGGLGVEIEGGIGIFTKGSIYTSGNGTYDIGSSTSTFNSIYANHLSIVGNGQTYISNSYISIYASSYNGTTNYTGIILSAAATNARISMYAASSIYITANAGTSNIHLGTSYYGVAYYNNGTQYYTSFYNKGIYMDSTGALKSCNTNCIAVASTLYANNQLLIGSSTYATTGGNVATSTNSTWNAYTTTMYATFVFTRMSSTKGMLEATITNNTGPTQDVWYRINLLYLLSIFNAQTKSILGNNELLSMPTALASWSSSYIGITVTGKRATAYGAGDNYTCYCSSHKSITTSTSFTGYAYFAYICNDNNNGGDRYGWTARITIPVYCKSNI